MSLETVDLNANIADEEYMVLLPKLQKKLYSLQKGCIEKKRSVVIVYQGWDAAGKGGNIKRLVSKLDPRYYQVILVGVPTEEELGHHYLWRFWRQLPGAGYMTIFDRSWYGRVLVERVENFASKFAWRQAYEEINQFEADLVKNEKFIIIKYFLHISQGVQLQRFKDRENNLFKKYKITEEDYRNRGKWESYRVAINDMLERTNSSHAQWNVIPSNSKKFARIEALKIAIKKIKKQLF